MASLAEQYSKASTEDKNQFLQYVYKESNKLAESN